jgi:hypothetical protein
MKEAKIVVMRLFGIALLWAGLAALVYVASSDGGGKGSIVAALGFVSFATGLSLFADALKAEIIRQLRQGRGGLEGADV